jgi:hypothetical protein
MKTIYPTTSMTTNYPTIFPFGIDGNTHTTPMANDPDISLLMFSPPLTSMAKGISPWGCSPYLHASNLSLLIFIFLPL